MRVRFSVDNPLDRKQKIKKTFNFPSSTNQLFKSLMLKASNGEMVILPVEVAAEYDDGTIESVTVFISTLAGKQNRKINVLTLPPKVENVTVKEYEKEIENDHEKYVHRVKRWFQNHGSILFLTGVFQLIILSVNMYSVAKANYLAILISAFFANLAFSYCVTKLTFSTWKNRIIYSAGCTLGCLIGTFIATKILP